MVRGIGSCCILHLSLLLGSASAFNPLRSNPISAPILNRRTNSSSTSSTSGSKHVFAHVVQGDFQNYDSTSWQEDMTLAKAAGIDAFALNVGGDSTDTAQMKLAFAAAGTAGFSLFFSFDMTLFNAAAKATTIGPMYLTPYASNSAYFKYDSKAFVSTFLGDTSGFFADGTASLAASNAWWTSLFNSLSIDVCFAPVWVAPASIAASPGVIQGVMAWAAWPNDGSDLTTALDTQYITADGSVTYIGQVSAFFFIQQRSDATGNRIYRCDDYLFPNHYSDLINLSPGPQFIEILTWNDFGESHYFGPTRALYGAPTGPTGYSAAAYSNSQFDHTPMLTLASYYNSWFKTGTAPTIKQETVFWWYRPHPATMKPATDPSGLGVPDNIAWTEDNMYAAVLIPEGSKAANLIFTTGGKATASQSVKAGVNLLKVAFVSGETAISLQDSSGNELAGGKGTAINSTIAFYNFNYYSFVFPTNATPDTLISGGALSTSGSNSSATSGNTTSTTPTGTPSSSNTTSPADNSTSSDTTLSSSGTPSSAGTPVAATSINTPATTPQAATPPESSSTVPLNPSPTIASSAANASSTSSNILGELQQIGWLGLQEWIWVVIFLSVPLLLLLAYLCTRHGQNSPPVVASKKKAAVKDDSSASGSESDASTATDDSTTALQKGKK